MAVTPRSEESALKVKEEEGSRELVAQGKVHGGDRPEKERLHSPQVFGRPSQGFSFLVSRLLSLHRFPVVGLL